MHISSSISVALRFLTLATALPFSHKADFATHIRADDKESDVGPSYPAWLGDAESPWDCFIGLSKDGTEAIPVTDTVRSYEFTITRGTLAPDGVSRDMLLVNNQYPGPLIEANWGEIVEVTVFNNITGPEEPTSMHWHGILQSDTPWADGVPGTSQCPIAPGSSFKYRFRADVYGTSWYHSHYSAQYTGGVTGPIQIYGPTVEPYDIDLGPVMITDWYHAPYTTVLQNFLRPGTAGPPPMSDSGLINGRGRFNCSLVQPDPATGEVAACEPDAPYSAFRFQSGKTHRLRLINNGAAGIQKFSIDDHDLTVIAEDFVPVKPYNTKIVTLGVGQRTDILVKAHADPNTSVWMRTQMPGGDICGSNDNTQVIRAGIFYEAADTEIPPASISENNDAACVNGPLTRSEPRKAKAITPDPLQLDLVLSLEVSDTGLFLWKINDHAYTPNLSDPLLFRDDLASATGDTLYNPGNARSVRLNVTNTTPIPHPFHLHGNHFQILASGPDVATSTNPNTAANPIVPPPATPWDGTIEVSSSNPARRDVHIVPALGYTVFQFDTNSPGVWPFHCHTAWHLAGGMSINFVVKSDQIASIPAGTKDDTCAAWSEWKSATSFEAVGLGR